MLIADNTGIVGQFSLFIFTTPYYHTITVLHLLFKNQYPKYLIVSKINKFLELHKIDSSTYKQNENINTKNEKKTATENCLYFTTVYVDSCSIRFQKHNNVIKLAYTSKKVVTTKVNARKFLTQTLL